MRDVVELSVPPQYAAEIALRLAKLLLPRHYCHIQDDTHMYVIFPRVVAIVYRDDPASIATAQELGARFDIPPRRMLFETMFGGGAGHE